MGKIKDRRYEIYQEQEKLTQELEELQEECDHPSTEFVNYSYGPGRMERVRACTECGKIIKTRMGAQTYSMPWIDPDGDDT